MEADHGSRSHPGVPDRGRRPNDRELDRVQEALGTRANPPTGGLVHTAGFDEEAGVFRIFDVWESQEAWDAFLNDRLMPIVRPMMEQGGRPPETRVYPLHDFMG